LIILQKNVSGVNASSLARFVLRARRAAGLRGTVNVLVTNGAALRALNRRFRGKNKSTDVLSFPSNSTSGHKRRSSPIAGEIAISADIAVQNAFRLGHSAGQEVKILALHGILHLAGYDHERDNGAMARKEAKLRKELRLPTALIERTQMERTQRGPRRRGGGKSSSSNARSPRSTA
jgi:probable rRNA maturation factor